MIAFVDPDLCIGCTSAPGCAPPYSTWRACWPWPSPAPSPPEEVPQAVDAANACPVSAIRTEA